MKKNKSAGIRKVVSVYGTEPDEEDEDADSDTKMLIGIVRMLIVLKVYKMEMFQLIE